MSRHNLILHVLNKLKRTRLLQSDSLHLSYHATQYIHGILCIFHKEFIDVCKICMKINIVLSINIQRAYR